MFTPEHVPPNVRPINPADAPLNLVRTWQMWMQSEGLAERTISDSGSIVLRASRATGEHPLAFTDEALVEWLAGFRAANTKASYWRALMAWHTWLRRTGRRLDDPMVAMRKPKRPRGVPHPISTEELGVLLDLPLRLRTRAMISLAAFAGLRVHEIAKLRGQDISITDKTLRVVGKGGVSAVLPLHPELEDLAAMMPARSWWFPSHTDPRRPIRSQSVTQTIIKTMTRAGVPGSAHSIRHHYGTVLVQTGTDLRTAQELLRHASLQTTQIYTQVTSEARSAAILRLPTPGERARRNLTALTCPPVPG